MYVVFYACLRLSLRLEQEFPKLKTLQGGGMFYKSTGILHVKLYLLKHVIKDLVLSGNWKLCFLVVLSEMS